jgi:hypothetical protein
MTDENLNALKIFCNSGITEMKKEIEKNSILKDWAEGNIFALQAVLEYIKSFNKINKIEKDSE